MDRQRSSISSETHDHLGYFVQNKELTIVASPSDGAL